MEASQVKDLKCLARQKVGRARTCRAVPPYIHIPVNVYFPIYLLATSSVLTRQYKLVFVY